MARICFGYFAPGARRTCSTGGLRWCGSRHRTNLKGKYSEVVIGVEEPLDDEMAETITSVHLSLCATGCPARWLLLRQALATMNCLSERFMAYFCQGAMRSLERRLRRDVRPGRLPATCALEGRTHRSGSDADSDATILCGPSAHSAPLNRLAAHSRSGFTWSASPAPLAGVHRTRLWVLSLVSPLGWLVTTS